MSRIIEAVYVALSELPAGMDARPVCLVNAHGWHETSWTKALAFWEHPDDRHAVCGSNRNVQPCSLADMTPCGHYDFDAEEPSLLLYLGSDDRYVFAASPSDLQAEPPANANLLRILEEEELLPSFLSPAEGQEAAR